MPSRQVSPASESVERVVERRLRVRASRRPASDGPLSSVHARVGRQVAEFRVAQGWTLAEMASRLGFGRATVADVEHGRQDLSLSRLSRVAEVLGVELSDLVASAGDRAGRGGDRR